MEAIPIRTILAALLALILIPVLLQQPALAGGSGGAYPVTPEGGVTADPHLGDPATQGIALWQPAVDAAGTESGNGYWVAAADSGVFSYGDAPFLGNLVGLDLHAPIFGIETGVNEGGGYWLFAADGGVFSFGVPFHGSLVGLMPAHHRAVDAVAHHRDGTGPVGYRITDDAGNVYDCLAGCVPTGDIVLLPPPENPWLVDVPQWFEEQIPALAECESGGNWAINTGNGYYGGLQFNAGTWRGVGGSGLPHQASMEEQVYRSWLLYSSSGWGPWPACTRMLGWR